MFGFSLGISETYMTVLVKTLEVLLLVCLFSMVALSRRKTQMRASSAVGDSEDGEGESRRAIVENIFIQWWVETQATHLSETSIVTDWVVPGDNLIAQHLISSHLFFFYKSEPGAMELLVRGNWLTLPSVWNYDCPFFWLLILKNVFITQCFTVAAVTAITRLRRSLDHTVFSEVLTQLCSAMSAV